MLLRGDIEGRVALLYVVVQIVTGCLGAVAAHLMFGLEPIQLSATARTGFGQWLGEFIATFGLIATILGCLRFRPGALAAAVGLYIGSAYWFTSSTSFANPAVTIARALSDTFSGIAPADAPGFIVAQILGAVVAAYLFGWLFAEPAAELKNRGRRGDSAEPRDLDFKRADTPIAFRDGLGDVLGKQHLRDVLRAIGVPSRNGNDNGLLSPSLVPVGEELRDQLSLVLDGARRSPDLHPLAGCVIHEEQHRAGVICEVAGRDVLPVAAEIGEGEGVRIENAQEFLRASAMLDVRLSVAVGGGEIEGSRVGDEGSEAVVDLGGEAALLLHADIGAARTAPILEALHRRRKSNVRRGRGHREVRSPAW